MPSPEEHYKAGNLKADDKLTGYMKVGDKWVKPISAAVVSAEPPQDFKDAIEIDFLRDQMKSAKAELSKYQVDCPVSRAVMQRIKERADKGMETYGVTMERTDISTVGWIDHAIEEALDLAVYLTRLKRDIQRLVGEVE